MELVELGTILEIAKGKKPVNQSSEIKKGYLPYVDIDAFENGSIKQYSDGIKCTPCDDGDILIVCDGSRSGLVGKAIKGYVGSTLAKISAKGLISDYLYYFVQGKYALLNTRKKGTGTPHLNPELLKQQKLIVPNQEEQQRIVDKIEELFSELDAGIETLKKTKAQLEIYRQSVLKEAFEGKLTTRFRKNHPNSTIEDIWKEICQRKSEFNRKKDYVFSENIVLPVLPDTWKWIHIGDITNGTEYGTSKKSSKIGKVPVIRMGNLQNGIIDWNDLVYSNDESEIDKYRLHTGDVLFNRTNSPELVGKTAIYNGEQKAIFAGYLIRINQFDCIDSDYLTYFMNSFVAKNYGNKVKTDGVNQSNINGQKLCSYPFPLCSKEEQRQVVFELETRLSACDNIEKTIENSIQQAEALRQSILKKAFEGSL